MSDTASMGTQSTRQAGWKVQVCLNHHNSHLQIRLGTRITTIIYRHNAHLILIMITSDKTFPNPHDYFLFGSIYFWMILTYTIIEMQLFDTFLMIRAAPENPLQWQLQGLAGPIGWISARGEGGGRGYFMILIVIDWVTIRYWVDIGSRRGGRSGI